MMGAVASSRTARAVAQRVTRPRAWPTATSPRTNALAPPTRSRRHEDRALLPLARLGLEPRQCALPPGRRAGAARAGPPGARLRAARRLEPHEPRDAARARSASGVPQDVPRAAQHAVR